MKPMNSVLPHKVIGLVKKRCQNKKNSRRQCVGVSVIGINRHSLWLNTSIVWAVFLKV